MALSNGQYAIINVTSGLALDVKDSSDKRGANVLVNTYGEADTQLWHCVKKSNGWQVICSATGKSLDAASSEGSNVQQFTDNDKKNTQRWTIEPTGNTYTLNGASYATYTLKKYSTSMYAVEAGTEAYSNVQISATSQEWAFANVPWLSDAGTYAFASALDTDTVITMESDVRQGRATLEVWDEKNRQTFQNVRWTEQGYNNLRRLETSKFMSWTSMDANIKAGRVLKQYDYDKNSTNQHYIFAQVGYTDLQGDTVPTYTIGVQSASNFVLDASNGTDDGIADYVTFQPKRTDENGDVVAAQQWVLLHTSRWIKGYTTPYNLGISTDGKNTVRSTSMSADETFTGKICLKTPDLQQNARYRVRGRVKGTSDFDVSPWRSAEDGSTAFNGWGDGWHNMWVGKRGSHVVFDHEFTLSWGNYDRLDVDIRARTVLLKTTNGSKEYTRSSESSYTVPILWEPAITLDSVIMTFSAVHVSLSSDYNQAGNHVKVSMCGGSASDVIAQSGEVEIPLSRLKTIPALGESVSVDVEWLTSDGCKVTKTLTGTVTYDGGTIDVNPSWTFDADTRCMVATLGNSYAARLFVEKPTGTEMYECPIVNGTAYVPYPLNQSYKVWVSVETDTDWGGKLQSFSAVKSREFVWNWNQCQKTAVAFAGIGAPSQSRKLTPDVSVTNTNGRAHPIAHAWGTVTASLDFDGVITVDKTLGSGTEEFTLLAHTAKSGEYPVYRTPYGDYERVVIEGVEMPPKDDKLVEVKITQQAVSVDD